MRGKSLPKHWHKPTKEAFKNLYELLKENPKLVAHYSMEPIPENHWEVVAWNAAWLAADYIEGTRP